VRRLHAIAAVQHLVANVRRQVELEPRRIGAQRLVQIDGVGRLEERAYRAAHLLVVVAHQRRTALEPAQLEPLVLCQRQQVVHRQRQPSLADALGRALQVGEVIARHLLVRADQQVCELAPAGSGLRQQFGDRGLQQLLGEQERRLQRHPGGAAGLRRPGLAGDIDLFVQEPADLALEHAGQQRQDVLGGHALAGLDHAQVGHRRRHLRVGLDAAAGEFLQSESIALADAAQLGAQEVTLA
jgi:hypothetical protein